MADIVSKEKRSEMMASVMRRNNKSTEQKLKTLLRNHKISGWRTHPKNITGTPDFYFPKSRLIVFVDGCFWHGCPLCKRNKKPKTNKKYWIDKIEENKRRDRRQANRLRKLGYSVLRIRECKLKRSPETTIRTITKKLSPKQ